MGHVAALDRLHVLDAYELAYQAGMDGLVHSPEIRAVSEDVAYGHDAAILVSLCGNVGALLLALGNRLLEKHVIAPLQCLHARMVMGVVRCGDDYCIGEFRHCENLAPVTETMFLRNVEIVPHCILAALADIGNAHNLHAFRINLGIIGVGASPVSRADDYYLHRTIDRGPEALDREIHLRVRH